MFKPVYSLEQMRALRATVEGVPPPLVLTQSGAFDQEAARKSALAKVRSQDDATRAHASMPPKQLSHDSISREAFFGAGAQRARKEASPTATKWVYRRKSGTEVSGSTSWADIETLIDDMLVEKDELELRPVGSTAAFMSFEEAVAFRSGKTSSSPTSPGGDWRATAGQRLGGARAAPPRAPHSPSFEAQGAAPQQHQHQHAHHHHQQQQQQQPVRATWTRDDMQARPSPPLHAGLRALGADLDEIDVGIGHVGPTPIVAPIAPVGLGEIGASMAAKEEVHTPSRLAASTSSDGGGPRPPMPMMPAPIDLGEAMGAGGAEPLDAGSSVEPSPSSAVAAAAIATATATNDAPASNEGTVVATAPKPSAAKKRREGKSLDAPEQASSKGAPKNAWGTAPAPATPSVDLETLLKEASSGKGPAVPPSAKKGANEWEGGAPRAAALPDLPSLSDVANGVSKKAAKEARQQPKHSAGDRGDEGFWDTAKPAVSFNDNFPSLEQALGGGSTALKTPAPQATAVAASAAATAAAKKKKK